MKVIVRGKAEGVVLKTETPINFLGSVDKKTGVISDNKHDLVGRQVGDYVLVFPYGVGSSVGAYTIYSLKSNNAAPKAMVCKKADITVASGCALANIPLVILSEEEYGTLDNGRRILLDTDSKTLKVVS
jgi:predicted aconitase with swiveling domain